MEDDRKLTSGSMKLHPGALSSVRWEILYQERNRAHEIVKEWTSWTRSVIFKVECNAICSVAQGKIHRPVNILFCFLALCLIFFFQIKHKRKLPLILKFLFEGKCAHRK